MKRGHPCTAVQGACAVACEASLRCAAYQTTSPASSIKLLMYLQARGAEAGRRRSASAQGSAENAARATVRVR